MPFEFSPSTHPAPPEIAQLADKYKGSFHSHLHVLASTGEILNEEHRKGVIGECDAWLRTIADARAPATFSARELQHIRRWASRLT